MPLGYIQGQKLDLELVRLTQHVATIRRFDELSIPFRAVATDIETGDEIVLSSGNLARAIRASMAVPGAFDAVELDGRLLVNGLVTNKREEIVEGGMVTGSLYRIAVLSLWASLCSNTALAVPCDKGGAQAQGRPDRPGAGRRRRTRRRARGCPEGAEGDAYSG